MKINHLQKIFANHIYKKTNQDIFTIFAHSKDEIKSRLEIYRNNVFGNYINVVESIFIKTKQHLGDELFYQFTNSYLKKYKSLSGNLDEYGQNFPNFLKANKAKHRIDYLFDLATLELYLHQCYFAKDAKEFDIPSFQKLTEEQYCSALFNLHDSCYLLESKFNLNMIWQEQKINKSEIKNSKKYYFLIHRCLQKEVVEDLSHEEYLFLQEIIKKTKLYDIYKKIISKSKKEFDIGQSLNKFIASGIISKHL